MFEQEKDILEQYLIHRGLRRSPQRVHILEAFLSTEQHLTAEALFKLVRRRHSTVGFATVYRTLRVLSECGLCRELMLEDGTTRFEHQYGHRHHDHLVCVRCNRLIEVLSEELEQLQSRVCAEHGFQPIRHRLDIYGLCPDCIKR